jgi:hypothetical protein
MKYGLALLLFLSTICSAQKWDAEVMVGITGYNGDLTQKLFSTHTFGPAGGFNIKYNLNYLVSLRAGFLYGSVQGSDRYNTQADLKKRNLNFFTNITEGNLCLEINLLEPQYFWAYPYLFGGVGVYHFNPYTYDKTAHRVYLQPLGTEGQGLPAYPDRKPYALTQVCIPFGGGFKMNLSKDFDLVYELSGRYLFTDYLDDVSTTYVNAQALMANNRPEAAVMYSRRNDNSIPVEGEIRGNPRVKDWYYFTGLKLLLHLGRQK